MDGNLQQRIRSRREAFGASVAEVAGWAEIPANRWRAIETGEPLSVAELGRVSRALAVDAGTLLRGEERSPSRSVVRFREAFSESPAPSADFLPAADARLLSLAAELGRIGGALVRKLGLPEPLTGVRRAIPVSDRQEPWKQGYELGEAARRDLGIPSGPLLSLQRTLEDRGIHVATVEFSGPEVDAAGLMEDGAVPMLLLNRKSARTVQTLPRRASMAHELCHLLHDFGEHDLTARVSRSEDRQESAEEQRARAFAPAFLAPRDEVRSWFKNGDGRKIATAEARVSAVARRWGLSWGGAVWHAKNCGLIRAATAERLAADSGPRPDWRGAFELEFLESDGSESDLPSRLGIEPSPLCRGTMAGWVHRALESGVISEGRAREILTWG